MTDAADIVLLSTPLAGRALPGGVCPSLSNLTLGSVLQQHGAKVKVIDPSVDLDFTFEFDDKGRQTVDIDALLDRIVAAALERRPRAVGVSCLSPTEGRFGVALAGAMARAAPEVPVVFGGVWATACAESIVRRFPEVAGIVTGPGERGALAITQNGLDRPEEVPGLVWRRGDTICHNDCDTSIAPAPPADLSLLARPEAYDIFCWLTSRGCPFHCAFCTERLTSPEFGVDPMSKVAADIAAFAEFAPHWYLWICDPLFGTRRPRLAEICDLLSGTPHGFLAETRVDVLHPDDVPRLRDAGCTLLYFGLEAVTRPALCELSKIDDRDSRFTRYLDGARQLVEACVRNDILPVMGVLQPAPGDTPADLDEALTFLTELASIPKRIGPSAGELGPCFHAFPVRFDRGAPYDSRAEHLANVGVTMTEVDDLLFDDRYLIEASPTVDQATAETFRAAVRALNPTSDVIRKRLWRSFPRPYVHFDVKQNHRG